MKITKYEDMNYLELDVIKEIGSIGTGNAATALSSLVAKPIKMTTPDVYILGYNDAIRLLGDPEQVVAAVLVRMSGEINGLMLYILKLDFINEVLAHLLNKEVTDYHELNVLEMSALEEIGNIIICSYISALSKLTDVAINLSVPGSTVNMLGGILSVPMAEFGYVTEKLMIIKGKFIVDNKELHSDLLMLPDIDSLNFLMEKLGVKDID